MVGVFIVVHFNSISGNLEIIHGLLEMGILSLIVGFESLDFGMFIHVFYDVLNILFCQVVGFGDRNRMSGDQIG